jgi:tRNA A37 threonylcarbamoyladenosine dehydratase
LADLDQPHRDGHLALRAVAQAEVECLNVMFTEETTDEVLAGNPDFVLDAIDNIDTKVGVLLAGWW